MMTTLKKEKKCETDRKRTNAKVFIWSHDPKTPGSKDREISTLPDFQGDFKTSGEKRRQKRFRALRQKRSGWGLRLNLGLSKRLWFVLEIYFDELCTRQSLKPTNENHDTFENGGFPLPKF